MYVPSEVYTEDSYFAINILGSEKETSHEVECWAYEDVLLSVGRGWQAPGSCSELLLRYSASCDLHCCLSR